MTSMKKTNSSQFERLVELMKRDVDLARGVYSVQHSKRDVKKKWNDIAVDLNFLGPPMRNGHEWQKVWIDTKGRVKKIMGENKANGKETHDKNKKIRHLTPLQQEIGVLLCLSQAASSPASSVESEEEIIDDVKPRSEVLDQLINGTGRFIEPVEAVTVDPFETNHTTHQPHDRSKTFDKRFALLKKQTTIQEDTLERLTNIQKNTFEIAKSLHQLVDVQVKRNQILEAELELKRRKLELKEKEQDRNVPKSD
ncbi:uncharacterized protein LOC118467413 [Anopheles albimanus]|uniref:Regulatory protein zeste n=1 Tax=Anopheles albimanus TaxID=7167 RepID=A0A182FE24_ANOAL|nr:uncharacterized protein LOC118467413 [Anopheles albimanus]